MNPIVITVFSSLVLILYIYNFFVFFIKKKKYKNLLQVVFYAVASYAIIVNIVVPWISDFCDRTNYFLLLSLQHLTLVVGNYLASSIKILSLQLEQLIASKDEIMRGEDIDSLTISNRVR